MTEENKLGEGPAEPAAVEEGAESEEERRGEHKMTIKAAHHRQHVAEQAAKLFIRLPLNLTLEAVERAYILEVLRLYQGNRAAAAEALGLSRRSIFTKIHAYAKDGASVCSAQ